VSRARILFATVSRHGGRWYVSLNVKAPDFHDQRRHQRIGTGSGGGVVGVDRGLSAFAVAATADGIEVGRFHSPKPMAGRLGRLRRRSRALSRARRGSHNRFKAARALAREHARIADARRNFLHQVSSQLVKTHARLAIEDLTVANLVRNKHLSRAISDAGWAELARQLTYKTAWLNGELVVCDRWFPSTRTCSCCGEVKRQMTLAERIFSCDACGLRMDRDCNAAANLAAWAEQQRTPDRQASGRVTKASGGDRVRRHRGDGEPGPDEGGTKARPFRMEPRTPEKGGVETDALRSVDTLYSSWRAAIRSATGG
jgi:putative transposase